MKDKKIIWLIMMVITTATYIGSVEAAFSSTYEPSNYFDKVRIEAFIPRGSNFSWDKIHIEHQNLIISNDSIWNKNDNAGYLFTCFTADSPLIIPELEAQMKANGAQQIVHKVYEIPTIEINYTGLTFWIYLQNQAKDTKEYTIRVTNGVEFLSENLSQSYKVPPNTVSDQYPIGLKLAVPKGMVVGEFKDFTYTVAEVQAIATDGTITPSIPFIKNYKIIVVDSQPPKGLELKYPTSNSTFHKNLLGKTEVDVEWTKVDEPNFKNYQVIVKDQNKQVVKNISVDDISTTEQHIEITDVVYGSYNVEVVANDKYRNSAVVSAPIRYEKPTVLHELTNYYVYIPMTLILLAVGFFIYKKKKPVEIKPEEVFEG